MQKNFFIILIVIILTLTGCSQSTAKLTESKEKVQTEPAKIENKLSDLEYSAKAQNITVKEILNHASFSGGRLGDKEFHGGEVLLWAAEPQQLTARCSLNLGNDVWRSTSVTAVIATPGDEPFSATAALLNDADVNERIVPIWAFYGTVNDPKIQHVLIEITGFSEIEATVRNGTWLAVYQGVIDRSFEVVCRATDQDFKVLYTEKYK